MRRLALLLALTACAHRQQLTNQDVAVAGVFVVMIAGVMVLEGVNDDCQRHPDCARHTLGPGDQTAIPPR